jgi:hypothetical protein
MSSKHPRDGTLAAEKKKARAAWKKLSGQHRRSYGEGWATFWRDWQMALAGRKHPNSIDV